MNLTTDTYSASDLLLLNRRDFQRGVPYSENVEPLLTVDL